MCWFSQVFVEQFNILFHHAGKKKEDVESFINEGVYMVERLKEEGWITDTKYDDEVK